MNRNQLPRDAKLVEPDQLDEDIEVESNKDGLFLKYEKQLPLTDSQRQFARVFFVLWNGMIGLLALVGCAMIVLLAFIKNADAKSLIAFLIFLPIWFGMLFLFYRVGRMLRAAISADRPFFGWRLSINSDGWRSEYFEAWNQHDKLLSPASINRIKPDGRNRLVADVLGKHVRLTTPLGQATRDRLQEKLTEVLAKGGTAARL